MESLKASLTLAPILIAPEWGEPLLLYIMSGHGIIANPEKIMAISNMGPIRNVKGVQRLTSYLAALSWFISRLGKQGMPLYKLLKKTDAFV